MLYDSPLSFLYGAEINYTQYGVDSFTRADDGSESIYNSYLGLFGWGVYGGRYKFLDERLTTYFGARFDASSLSTQTQQFWRTPPIAELRSGGWLLTGWVGWKLYHSLPPLTALSYKMTMARLSIVISTTSRWCTTPQGWSGDPSGEIFASVEAFYKDYSRLPISVEDGIPLADLGDDYGVVGNEPFISSGRGRAYGVELMGQWQVAGRLSLVGSLTLFRSEYAVSSSA